MQSAVDLALKNSPRIRIAQADLAKARAAWQEARDAYIPAVSTTAGYGQATGAPLNVPIIFSISAQSLVFSFQQRDYVRAAEEARESAQHALNREQIQVIQDTTNTYVALDNAQLRKTVVQRELDLADRLVTVTSERIDAGVDAKVELPKSRRTSLQIRLAALQLDDEIAFNARHLATLTGLPVAAIRTDPRSIPEIAPIRARQAQQEVADDEGIAALASTARSKQHQAFGDRRYLLRPQVSLGASYSRVDTGLSSYAAYYPHYGAAGNSENALSFGLSFTIPLLDMAHRARARQSEADAEHAGADVLLQRGIFQEGQAKLRNSAVELQLRTDLAQQEQEIAEDQFETLQIQLQSAAGSSSAPQANPKDALNAELQERQRYYDLLLSRLQLQQVQVNLLQQDGGLSRWVQGTPVSTAPTPFQRPGANTPTVPATTTPSLPGTPPQGVTPAPPPVPVPPTAPR
ncbi:TolC family protein [Terriglobus aquaticus]|uniref:TolC family protein n=1 Tax=Terriglobus aquaticus TaxID=940139 RepID=A0ABW9KLA1_9BACT